jgi:hypothetical protein
MTLHLRYSTNLIASALERPSVLIKTAAIGGIVVVFKGYLI